MSFLNGPKSPRVLILYPSLPKNLSAILANFVVHKASEDATMIATWSSSLDMIASSEIASMKFSCRIIATILQLRIATPECSNISSLTAHIILLYLDIVSLVQPGRTAPASHCRGTTGNPFYRIFMPFSSTVITSTSIALPSSSRSTVSFFGLSSL